jgi:hypothetical protein
VAYDTGQSTLSACPDRTVTFLNFETRWFALILAAIFPSDISTVKTGADRVPMASFLKDVAQNAPFLPLLGIRAALWVVMFGPLLFIGKPRSFARLAAADQTRMLERMARSNLYPIREIPILLKTIGCLGYGSIPAVQREAGLEGLPLDEPSWARQKESA